MDASPSPQARVLIVEDDPGIRHLQRRSLERAGYHVQCAGNLAEARLQLTENNVDLLVLDYRLENGEFGLDFYRQLQSEGIEIPAILVTGFSDEARIIEAMRAGMRDFIFKTSNFIDLVAPTADRVMEQVKRERQLLESQMAGKAKDIFLATLSHELRTPLSPVLILVAELCADTRLPADVRKDLEMIHRNVTLEAQLIDDLLDATTVRSGKLEIQCKPVDIRSLLEHAIETVSKSAASAKEINCSTHFVLTHSLVNADNRRLTQVFWNLLRNAVKFTPSRGTICVNCFEEDRDLKSWVVIEVIDSGIGIDPAALGKVFTAFEQLNSSITREFGGLGLGLTISKAIVDAHGGTLSAYSEGLGHGSTFRVCLPLALPLEHSSIVAPPSAPPPSTAQRRGAHLLLVEDHDDTAAVMIRLLNRAGYVVTHARTVEKALLEVQGAMFSNGAFGPVRLVVSDLELPDRSGHEMMLELNAQFGLPGIALSGFGMDDDVQRALASGFSHHMTKPVDFPLLLGKLDLILNSSLS